MAVPTRRDRMIQTFQKVQRSRAKEVKEEEKPKDEKSRQQAKSQEAKFKQPIPKKAGALAAGKTQ